MKVRMKVQMSGSRNGEDWPAVGEVIDLDVDEAALYLTSGVCAPLKGDDVETADAVDDDAETTMAPARRGRSKAKA